MKLNLNYLATALFLAVCSIFPVAAQTTVNYGYDASGNRVERNVIGLKSAKTDSIENKTSEKKTEVFEDVIGKQKLLIYPNPTLGMLNIEVQGYENGTQIKIYVYNISGMLLISKAPADIPAVIDLSKYPAGTYMLKIMLGNKVSEWKIIKE